MNRGLWIKAVREAWLPTALFAAGVAVFMGLVTAVLPSFHEQLQSSFLQIPFMRNILRVVLGADIGEEIGPLIVGSIVWVHPVVMSLIWAHEIVFCTRVPAAEVDRGTIDVLLALPVSRWRAYCTESAVWLVSGVVILLTGLGAHLLGLLTAGSEYTPTSDRLVAVLLNLFALYLTVGGIAYLASACSARRGRAIGTVFAVVIVSYFINALAQLWEPAKSFEYLGFMHYYRPFEILNGSGFPAGDIAVLTGVGLVCWVAGGVVFARRDICTV